MAIAAIALIGPLADYVAGRTVIANPDFPLPGPCQAAADVSRFTPHDLRVVAAHVGTRVSRVIVGLYLRSPRIVNEGNGSSAVGDGEQVLAVPVIAIVTELAGLDERNGPVSRTAGQILRPCEGRKTEPVSCPVMQFQDVGPPVRSAVLLREAG
jgi:hypothetical protein